MEMAGYYYSRRSAVSRFYDGQKQIMAKRWPIEWIKHLNHSMSYRISAIEIKATVKRFWPHKSWVREKLHTSRRARKFGSAVRSIKASSLQLLLFFYCCCCCCCRVMVVCFVSPAPAVGSASFHSMSGLNIKYWHKLLLGL